MSRPRSRRAAVLGASALVVAALVSVPDARAVDEQFAQPLRIPATLTGADITLDAVEAPVQVFADGPATTMWTFNGAFPGPVIRRPAGEETRVTVRNRLPDEAGDITIHRHGGHQESASDGQPGVTAVPVGGERTYVYDLTDDGAPERAAFEWYHDHSHHRTGRNVWRGLAGMFIVEDDAEAALGLPSGDRDLPLLIADRSFDDQNQLTDPFTAPHRHDHAPGTAVGEGWPPFDEVVGDTILVNGVPTPHHVVEPARYRLRLLNAANFRPLNLTIPGAEMIQVATDGGLLPAAAQRETILLGPGERAEVIVDFAGLEGRDLVVRSVALADPPTVPGTEPAIAPVMQFRVGAAPVDEPSAAVVDGQPLRPLPEWADALTGQIDRRWVFGLGAGSDGHPAWTINGRDFDHERVDARVELGSTETWQFVNASPRSMSHWIHVHAADWVVLSRNGSPPAAGEEGLKDTFRLDPGESLVVAARFSEHLGRFMIHCHMLEHEDQGMMTSFEVVPPGEGDAGVPAPDPGSPPSLPDTPEVPDLPGAPETPDVATPGGVVIAAQGGVTTLFVPPTPVIASGTQLQLVNADLAQHDVTAVDTDASGRPLFRSATIGFGQWTPVRGTELLGPGSYPFYCWVHPGMRGTLEVVGP